MYVEVTMDCASAGAGSMPDHLPTYTFSKSRFLGQSWCRLFCSGNEELTTTGENSTSPEESRDSNTVDRGFCWYNSPPASTGSSRKIELEACHRESSRGFRVLCRRVK